MKVLQTNEPTRVTVIYPNFNLESASINIDLHYLAKLYKTSAGS